MLNRTTAFLYGVACYLVTLVTFLFLAGFLGNIGLAKTIDSEPQVPFMRALVINCALLGFLPGSTASWRGSGSKPCGRE